MSEYGTAVGALSEEERKELAAVLDSFLADVYPVERTRDLEPGEGVDRARWQRLARELDVLGLRVPEQYGGQALAFAHTVLVAERIGRHLAPVPYLASAGLVIPLLLRLGSEEQRRKWLPALVGGDAIGAFASPLRCGGTAAVTARKRGSGHVLDGAVPFVMYGADADLLLVEAQQEDGGACLFLVEAGTAGLAVQPMSVVDPSRPLARVVLEACPAQPLAVPEPHRPHVDAVVAEGRILLGAEAVGAASAALDLAVEHVKGRHQFGRPIGSFQAVQQTLADLYGEMESARACVDWAVAVVDGQAGPAEVAHAASVVKVRTAAALDVVARQSLHLHGGMGFTWEHGSHLYLKRSLGDRAILGTPEEHRARIAGALGAR